MADLTDYATREQISSFLDFSDEDWAMMGAIEQDFLIKQDFSPSNVLFNTQSPQVFASTPPGSSQYVRQFPHRYPSPGEGNNNIQTPYFVPQQFGDEHAWQPQESDFDDLFGSSGNGADYLGTDLQNDCYTPTAPTEVVEIARSETFFENGNIDPVLVSHDNPAFLNLSPLTLPTFPGLEEQDFPKALIPNYVPDLDHPYEDVKEASPFKSSTSSLKTEPSPKQEKVSSAAESDNDYAPPAKRTRAFRNKSTSSSESQPHKNSSISSKSSIKQTRAAKREKAKVVAANLKPQKPKVDPSKEFVRVNTSTQGLNKRPAKCSEFDPGLVYDELPQTPRPWGDFHYTSHGELATGEKYDAAQMIQYLYNHPLHFDESTGMQDRKHSKLRLWIQQVPSDSARRYATATSSRCRFEECFGPKNVCNVGHYRVAFDEQGHDRSRNLDPFINAGYVHLYCLEKLMDLPTLVKDLNFRPENRILEDEFQGKNAMSLGDKAALRTARKFIGDCTRDACPHDYPRNIDHPDLTQKPHEGTLAHRITVAKLSQESPARQRARMNRGEKPTNISVHLGNLEMVIEAKDDARIAKIQAREAEKGKRKRKVEDDDDDDDDLGDERDTIVFASPSASGAKKIRRTKKRKADFPDW
ncbi:MAG: hypothetical protein M1827_006698 [Pycnora praestabilis]|nr:MAG: hypothetical protein M1827_006698 [Pycnora praestabilis]